MRCGTEATLQGRAWPTRGASGAGGMDMWQEATRVHADACEGRHVARGGRRVKGPRVSEPWIEVWGGNANAPAFILTISVFLVRVGLCSRGFFFCR